ncbi:SEM7A protein, partial [Illadopsis cleaveri]|nr:SEM7A protein [Illadopsis cleaveri]
VPFSRYYLNCSIESHYATYHWYHENVTIKSCNTSHPQRDCFHFIPSVQQEHYGHYVCKSEEDGFSQVLVKERLLYRQPFWQHGHAPATLPSCLQLLLLLALAELFH